VLLLVGLLASGCSVYSASSWNRQQWDAQKAFLGCAMPALQETAKVASDTGQRDPGQAYVAFDPAPDGTLYYTPLRNPAAEARLAECLRTKHPDLKTVAGARPK